MLLATSDEESASPDKKSALASPSVPSDGHGAEGAAGSGAEIGSHQLDDTDSLGQASEDMVLGEGEGQGEVKVGSPTGQASPPPQSGDVCGTRTKGNSGDSLLIPAMELPGDAPLSVGVQQ